MKILGFAACLACVIICGAGAHAAVGAEQRLTWKFETGQKRAFVLSQRKAMVMEIGGNKVPTSVAQTTFIRWEVKGVGKDGSADIVQTIDRIKFQMIAAPIGPSFEVDTSTPHDTVETPERFSKVFRSASEP